MGHKRRIWKRVKPKKYKWNYNVLGRLFLEVKQ